MNRFENSVKMAALSISIVVALTGSVRAGGAEAVVGGVVGFAAGVLTGQALSNNRGTKTRRNKPRRTANPQREENKKIQTVLNSLGCDAGTPDGVFGRRTAKAIRCFQQSQNLSVTGRLSDTERGNLLAFYYSGRLPGIPAAPIPGGDGNLQQAQNQKSADPRLFQPPPSALVPSPPAIEQPSVSEEFSKADFDKNNQAFRDLLHSDLNRVPGRDGIDPSKTPQTVHVVKDAPSGPAEGLLPEGPSGTIAALCQEANAPLGASFTARKVSVEDEIGSRFCTLRDAIYVDAREIINRTPGFSLDTYTQECTNIAQQHASTVSAISSKDPTKLINDLRGAFQDNDDGLQAALRICVALGYDIEKPKVALASALALFSMRRVEFGEVIAGHVALGLGVLSNKNLAATWLKLTAAGVNGKYPPIDGTSPEEASEELLALASSLDADLAKETANIAKAESYMSVQRFNAIKLSGNFDQIFSLSEDDLRQTCVDVAQRGPDMIGHDGVRKVFFEVCRVVGHTSADLELISSYEAWTASGSEKRNFLPVSQQEGVKKAGTF